MISTILAQGGLDPTMVIGENWQASAAMPD